MAKQRNIVSVPFFFHQLRVTSEQSDFKGLSPLERRPRRKPRENFFLFSPPLRKPFTGGNVLASTRLLTSSLLLTPEFLAEESADLKRSVEPARSPSSPLDDEEAPSDFFHLDLHAGTRPASPPLIQVLAPRPATTFMRRTAFNFLFSLRSLGEAS